MPSQTCRWCGDHFLASPSVLAKRHGIYCCRACVTSYRESDEAIKLRFIRLIDVAADDECWEWLGRIGTSGYGGFGFQKDGRRIFESAHRCAFRFEFGEIPEGMLVLHRCDNRSCVNPHHLFLGSVADNNRDCVQKGRMRPRNSALTPDNVREIRQRVSSGVSIKSIAREFGVDAHTVSKAVSGKSWTWVE